MNGKTAKLLRRYSLLTGDKEKDLKRQWLALNSRQRFERRQEILSTLKSKK